MARLGDVLPDLAMSVCMKNDWVISVLLDLKEYARHNGLPRLADELDTARLIGLMEMEQAYDARYVPVNDTLENY